jgi:hypothetical protein
MANIKIMRDSWTGKGTAAPVARALNKAGRCVNGIRVEGGGNVQKFGNNIVIPRTVLASIKEMFGIKSISGATVTIYAGKIWIGKTEKVAAETPLTLNTDSYVGWEYAFGEGLEYEIGGSLTIKNFGSTFTQDDGFIRKPLYLFTYTAPVAPATVGSIKLNSGCHMCDVYPANWGVY